MINSLNFYYFYLFTSVIAIIYAFFKDRGQLEIKWDAIAKFTGFMVILSMYRLCIFDQVLNINTLPMKMSNFLLVFLEDAFFVMIPYYITKKVKNKLINYTIWAIFSVLFASGHVYQGLFVATITGFYPYFISRKYALKTSFITVMACHFMYDCFTFLTLKLAKIFSIFRPYL